MTKHRAWWATVNQARGKGYEPISRLVLREQMAILALGKEYLLAVEDDFTSAGDKLAPDRQLILTGYAGPLDPALDRCRLVVPVETRAILPAPNHALTARVALWITEHIVPHVGWDLAKIRAEFDGLTDKVTPASLPKRRPMGDSEVKDWISAHFSPGGGSSPSALLRAFRSHGLACEQSRFRGLFAEALRDLEAGRS